MRYERKTYEESIFQEDNFDKSFRFVFFEVSSGFIFEFKNFKYTKKMFDDDELVYLKM